MPPKRPGVVREDGTVDFSRLEDTLSSAMESEDRYWRENDAKMRAVAQKVQSYEEFEAMVKAAHIKPMTEDVTQLQLERSSWRSATTSDAFSDRVKQASGSSASSTRDPSAKLHEGVSTPQAFHKAWRNHRKNPQQRRKLLLSTTDALLKETFPAGLGDGFLLDAVDAMLDETASQDTEAGIEQDDANIKRILQFMASTPRFDLELEFLTDSEAAKVTRLLQRLKEDEARVKLMAAYSQ